MKKKKLRKLPLRKLKIAKIDLSEKVVGGGSRVFQCFSVGDPFDCITDYIRCMD